MNRKTPVLSALFTILLFTANAQQVARITPSGIGYLEYLPDGYHASSANYPVVISLHGIKEKGTSSTNPQQVLRDLPRVANVGLPKYVKAGKKYPFILISPQLKSQHGTWPSSFVMEVVNHVRKNLRIDDKRIYLTGLSLGGFGVWRTAGAYPEVFAAIAPICAGGNSLENANAIAKEDVATWGFHGDADKIVSYTVTTRMVNAINGAPDKPNPLAKVTIFPRMGHTIWDKVYNETNVLDWMLTFRNGSAGGGQPAENKSNEPANRAPVANAGADQTVTLPNNTVVIQGKATDADGKIAHYQWSKESGGSATLGQTSVQTLQVNNLVQGIYVFRFTVKDDDGAISSDEVKVHVKASENRRPAVNAGADQTTTLPSNTVVLKGSATDSDGQITSLQWAKISGGSAQLSETNAATLTVSNLVEGTYVFRLRGEDNDGSVETDDVTVTVKKNAAENTPPMVNAGTDRTLMLPENSTRLQGNVRDEDGSIVSYRWTQIGGSPASIDGLSANNAQVSNLKEGTYVFRLTVTDDRGASGSDDVRVTVSKQATANNPRDEQNGGGQSQDILPQSYPGPVRDGEEIEYAPPIIDKPWVTGG